MNNTLDFPSYGIFDIDDSLEFKIPNNALNLTKISENVFSYVRKDSSGKLTEKIIPSNTDSLKIEFAPIDALTYPANRTNLMYLELETPVFMLQSSIAKIFVQCPIELGIFILHDSKKESLDSFTCDPMKSRFALHGSADSGLLCKYHKSHVVNSYDDHEPFVNTVMQINIENQLDKGYTISKVVFPITDHKLYYKDTHAKYDTLNAVIKKKLTVEVLDVQNVTIETDWVQAPEFESEVNYKRIDLNLD